MCQEENTHVRGGCAKGWVTLGLGLPGDPSIHPPKLGWSKLLPCTAAQSCSQK